MHGLYNDGNIRGTHKGIGIMSLYHRESVEEDFLASAPPGTPSAGYASGRTRSAAFPSLTAPTDNRRSNVASRPPWATARPSR